MPLTTYSLDSPLGEILTTIDPLGVIHTLLFAKRTWDRDGSTGRAPGGWLRPAPPRVSAAVAAYFDGDHRALATLAMAPRGLPLHERMSAALLRIAPGSTLSYSELAREVGLDGPRGALEIGAALAANSLALIVPCHRVIGKDGDLKGFAWGIARKRWLLEHEGALRSRSLFF